MSAISRGLHVVHGHPIELDLPSRYLSRRADGPLDLRARIFFAPGARDENRERFHDIIACEWGPRRPSRHARAAIGSRWGVAGRL